jgi:thiamine-monophosphate kinase
MTNAISKPKPGAGLPGEFELIEDLFAPIARTPGALGLSDDVALIKPPKGRDIAFTTDTLVEGVHFRAVDPPLAIAKKALRVNLSDLAAKGAEPESYLLALSIPESTELSWLKAFVRGLSQDQKAFHVSLVGGDTTRTPGPLTISIAAIGYVPAGKLIKRSGAKHGDVVFVSGTVGDAGAGLEIAANGPPRGADARQLVGRYLLPEPRVALGQALRGIATAALDVSDGLLADLGHIADASKVHIAVDGPKVPLSEAARRYFRGGTDGIIRAATAGDDYELAFCCSARHEARIATLSRSAGVPLTRIGRVVRGRGVSLLDADGHQINVGRGGYTHF